MSKSVRRLAPYVLLTGLISLVSARPQCASLPGWYDNYEQALAVARKTGKPVLADFSTDWCPNCRQLEKTTLRNPQVNSRLDQFVKVYVDGDRYKDKVAAFNVEGFPTIVALDPNGRELDRSVGYVDPSELTPTLDNAIRTVAASNPKPAAAKGAQKTVAAAAQGKNAKDARGKLAATDQKVRVQAEVASSREGSRTDSAELDAPSRTAKTVSAQQIIKGQNSSGKAPAVVAVSNRKSDLFEAPRELKGRKERLVAAANESSARTKLQSGVPGGGAEPGSTTDTGSGAGETSGEDLPKPILKAGATRSGSEDKEKESGQAESTSKQGTATEKSSGKESGDPLSTIRKLQGTTKPGESSDTKDKAKAKASKETEKAAATEKSASKAKETAKPEDNELPTSKPETAASATAKTKGKNKDTESATRQEDSSSKSGDTPATDAPSEEKSSKETAVKPAAGDTPKASEADIRRWMKDAESKLLQDRRKEARAMYEKVVENDPKNQYGQSDLAFIKATSLIVDSDDDALRRKAYNKIREFEGRFPDSKHKDYYSLIRATLAADLGDTNAAHRLLDNYADRFPDSRYKKIAYDTWKELPPVTKEKPGSKDKASDSKSKSGSSKDKASSSKEKSSSKSDSAKKSSSSSKSTASKKNGNGKDSSSSKNGSASKSSSSNGSKSGSKSGNWKSSETASKSESSSKSSSSR